MSKTLSFSINKPPSIGLLGRILILGTLFLCEKIFLSTFVNYQLAQAARGFGAFVREAQHWGFHFLVALIAFLVLFVYVRGGSSLRLADRELRSTKFSGRWMVGHVVFASLLPWLSNLLYSTDAVPLSFSTVVLLWLALSLTASACAIFAMAPSALWLKVANAIGDIWIYAAVAALISTSAMHLSQLIWVYTATLTFDLVKDCLSPILPSITSDGSTHVLSTDRFAVQVSEVCSGLEGMGLILAFTTCWLVYFRREYIFPRALLLIPVGLLLIFALNILRIATLVLIGDAGYSDVAVYGFHSQAGWIAFITVACTLVFFSRKSRWLNRIAIIETGDSTFDNPTAVYLMPFLAIIAAGILSHAMSGKFESFYPLRSLACLVAIYVYRDRLLVLDWRCSWRGPLVGGVVFILWAAAAHKLLPQTAMPDGLAVLPPLGRAFWISIRVFAAVITVPIAEELAFRGYLMRRWAHADFETLPYRAVGWPAMMGAAVVFGLGHGAMWLPGIAAGAAYGWLVVRFGHLGEAIAAHATTNGMIVLCVLVGNQWQLW